MLKILEKEDTQMKQNEGCQPRKEIEQNENSHLKNLISAVVEVMKTDEVQDIFEGKNMKRCF